MGPSAVSGETSAGFKVSLRGAGNERPGGLVTVRLPTARAVPSLTGGQQIRFLRGWCVGTPAPTIVEVSGPGPWATTQLPMCELVGDTKAVGPTSAVGV